MLQELRGVEFEQWCKTVFERHYGCRVEATKATGDEGRDLIIHHPSGAIVVECKHYPQGTVGRPVVQKLHSAMLTYGAASGLLVTTGRFSQEARDYAAKLPERIELLEGSQLDALAQNVGVKAGNSSAGATAIPTTPDPAFRALLLGLVAGEGRFVPMRGQWPVVHVKRTTSYMGYYVGDYSAWGKAKTANGPHTSTWAGKVWLAASDGSVGLGEPAEGLDSCQDLATVLQSTPGPAPPPRIPFGRAELAIRDHLVDGLVQRVSYRGANNVSYSKEIRPIKSQTEVRGLRLVYVPRQTVEVSGLAAPWQGTVTETASSLALDCLPLKQCRICKGSTSKARHVICAVCHCAAHTASPLHRDSFSCATCKATLCRKDARRFQKKVVCPACAPADARPFPHRLAVPGAVTGGLAALFLLAGAAAGPQALPGMTLLAGLSLVPFGLAAGPKGGNRLAPVRYAKKKR